MPDQRMHDLRINSESACGRKSCEVHDIRFIDSESVCVLDGDEGAEKACGDPAQGSQRVGLRLAARDALVESSPFVENDGR
jgi:hypothetical protein